MRSTTVLRSEGVLVLGLVLLVALVWMVERSMGAVGRTPVGVLPGLALAVVPALLWLAFFYRQDRHEPEPLHYVGGVFLLGALVAAPVAAWLENLVGAHEWCVSSKGLVTFTAGSFLTYAIAQEFMKYAVVRYTVYLSAEFDEPVDGIIYMTAAGLGYATARNFEYITDTGGVYLTAGTVNVVVTTLAHGSFAAITGYFMGSARFGEGRLAQARLLGGVLLAAAVNAIFEAAHARLLSGGGFVGHAPALWKGLALYGGGVILVFAGVFWLMRRQVALSPHAAAAAAGAKVAERTEPEAAGAVAVGAAAAVPPPKPTFFDRVTQLDLIVLPAVAVVILAGWALGDRHRTATDTFLETTSGASFRFPMGWLCTSGASPDLGEAAHVECVDPLSEGHAKARFTLSVQDVGAEVRTFGVENYLEANPPEERPLYAKIAVGDATLSGTPARRTEYAFAWREVASDDVPVVMHGIDAVALRGNRLYIASFTAEASAFAAHRARIEYMLGSVVIP